MKFEDLAPELQEKAKACETPEDILALAQEEGYELSDEELVAVSDGEEWVERCNDQTCSCYSPM